MTIRKYHSWKKEIIKHKKDLFLSSVFLFFSLVVFTLSNQYVDEINAVPVPDLILDNIPTIDLSYVYIWGIIVVVTIFIA